MMIISAKKFLNPTMHDEVMGWTRFWNAQTLMPTVALTFDLAIWVMNPTHGLVVMIISAK